VEREAAAAEVGTMIEDVGGGRNQDVRPDVLDQARAEYVELAARMQADVMRIIADLELNPAEQLRMAVDLAGAAMGDLKDVDVLREPPGLLELNRHEVGLIVERGLALYWLVDQLGMSWATRPDTSLVDILKIEPLKRIAYLARQLRKAGIHDLDELSPPDLMTNDADDG
jgi:hypothetical protein